MKGKLLFLLFFLLINYNNTCFSYEKKDIKKSRLFIQLGLVTYGSAYIKYQYFFKNSEIEKLGFGLGFGMWYNMDLFGFLDSEFGRRYDVGFQYLKGGERHFFDLELGIIFHETMNVTGPVYKGKLSPTLWPQFSYSYTLVPNINIGYRLESSSFFIFRIGGGLPEIIKMSLGAKF